MISAAQAQERGLSIGDILSGIPHDTPAIIVYVLIGLFIGFIWMGSRSRGPGESRKGDSSAERR